MYNLICVSFKLYICIWYYPAFNNNLETYLPFLIVCVTYLTSNCNNMCFHLRYVIKTIRRWPVVSTRSSYPQLKKLDRILTFEWKQRVVSHRRLFEIRYWFTHTLDGWLSAHIMLLYTTIISLSLPKWSTTLRLSVIRFPCYLRHEYYCKFSVDFEKSTLYLTIF